MGQSWIDLLFAHWPVPAEKLAPVMPPQLAPDTFEGRAWIAITPFEVRNLRVRATWPVPGLSRFGEINVRTYVSLGGRPGIYFFSLDAASRSAVKAARRFYRLPYHRALISIARGTAGISHHSQRIPGAEVPDAIFEADYRASGESAPAAAGTLEHWLTERYCLYTLDESRRVLRAEIHHRPWQLQPAAAEIKRNSTTDQIGVPLSGRPLLHYAARQDVVFWTLERAT
jgi:uncharacterized protein YqjF (DUF2071 family)